MQVQSRPCSCDNGSAGISAGIVLPRVSSCSELADRNARIHLGEAQLSPPRNPAHEAPDVVNHATVSHDDDVCAWVSEGDAVQGDAEAPEARPARLAPSRDRKVGVVAPARVRFRVVRLYVFPPQALPVPKVRLAQTRLAPHRKP